MCIRRTTFVFLLALNNLIFIITLNLIHICILVINCFYFVFLECPYPGTNRLHNNLPTLSSAPGIVPERVFDNPTGIRNPTGHLHCACLQITKVSPLWQLDGIWESFPSQIRYFDNNRDTAITKPNFYFSRNPVLPKLNSTPLFQRLPGSFTNNETHTVTTMRMSQY